MGMIGIGINLRALAHTELTALSAGDRYLATVLLDTLSVHGHRADVRAARTRVLRADRDNFVDPLAKSPATRREERERRIIRRRMLARRKAVQA